MMAAILYMTTDYSLTQSVEVFHITGLNEALLTWWNGHNQLGIWITPVSIAIGMYLIRNSRGIPSTATSWPISPSGGSSPSIPHREPST